MFKKKPLNITMSDFQKLQERISKLEKSEEEKNTIVNDRMDVLENELENLRKQVKLNKNQVDEYIKNQEEIIIDMINKFNDQFLNYRSKFLSSLEDLKTQQDVLKISYSVNEKHLIEKVNEHIEHQIKNAVKGKEKEILMTIWLDELKEIINDFEKLKKMHPREFKTQIQEISETIEHFKRQIEV
jgi:hypothetical protein